MNVLGEYENFLKENNITQEFMDYTLALPTVFKKAGDIKLGESAIHGTGVFAAKDFLPGDFVCSTILNGERTLGGRYTNHSYHPNVKGDGVGDFCMIAIKKIQRGEEILINYSQVFDLFKPYLAQRGALCRG